MKGSAEFYLDMLIEEPSHQWLVTAPANSTENAFLLPDGTKANICMEITETEPQTDSVLEHILAFSREAGINLAIDDFGQGFSNMERYLTLNPSCVKLSRESFLKALLASARSGMILTRQDLARAGRTLGLGVRLGERAYVIKALLAQDANATLAWLADEARRWRDPHTEPGPAPAIRGFWRARAAATANLLDELASNEAPTHWTASAEGAPTPKATEAHHA